MCGINWRDNPWGLSPLARGNQNPASGFRVAFRPIPARTGQPFGDDSAELLAEAYPRSHGATSRPTPMPAPAWGLSPLARGNPQWPDVLPARLRPIPARTGQPSGRGGSRSRNWAYPRSHGATRANSIGMRAQTGLSPLARGNPVVARVRRSYWRPIPARTGQPLLCGGGLFWGGAYPRSHGATRVANLQRCAARGLSPLARGNPKDSTQGNIASGPIPARTGQPSPGSGRACYQGAYPRSHGATRRANRGIPRLGGLSPLARGNLGAGGA